MPAAATWQAPTLVGHPLGAAAQPGAVVPLAGPHLRTGAGVGQGEVVMRGKALLNQAHMAR